VRKPRPFRGCCALKKEINIWTVNSATIVLK